MDNTHSTSIETNRDTSLEISGKERPKPEFVQKMEASFERVRLINEEFDRQKRDGGALNQELLDRLNDERIVSVSPRYRKYMRNLSRAKTTSLET